MTRCPRCVLLFGTAALLFGCLPAERQPQDAGTLPADVVAAWKKAGAQHGSVGPHHHGQVGFEATPTYLTRPLPGFQLGFTKAGTLAALPAPADPFSLVVTDAPIRDDDLKDLAR